MARNIEQCREKIEELTRERRRYTNDTAFGPYFKITGHIMQIERRLDVMLGRKRQADIAALDRPVVLTGDVAIDTLNRIERDRLIASVAKRDHAIEVTAPVILAPADSVPLPAAVLAKVNVATVEPQDVPAEDLDARIASLLPDPD